MQKIATNRFKKRRKRKVLNLKKIKKYTKSIIPKGCRRKCSARKYTWFEDSSRLSIEKSILMVYLFASRCSAKKAVEESSIDDEQTSPETVSDYYSYYCREVCAETVVKNGATKIGGPGMTVEIDEGRFGKRKYNRGRLVDGVWVLGWICRETKEVFLVPVEKRDADTLIPIIVEKVSPGTIIMTDCWKAYDRLPEHEPIRDRPSRPNPF